MKSLPFWPMILIVFALLFTACRQQPMPTPAAPVSPAEIPAEEPTTEGVPTAESPPTTESPSTAVPPTPLPAAAEPSLDLLAFDADAYTLSGNLTVDICQPGAACGDLELPADSPVQVRLAWQTPAALAHLTLPGGPQDITAYDSLRLFASQTPGSSLNADGQPQPVTLLLTDADGQRIRVNLPQPIAAEATEIIVPVAALLGVDVTAVESIALLFDQSQSGDILLADFAFVGEAAPDVAMPDDPSLADVQPWAAGTLVADFPVVGEADGSCWTGSLAVGRPDAWRCQAELETVAQIFDPCFVNEVGETAVCLQADLSAFILNLAEPPPPEFANTSGVDRLPLLLELASGDQCTLALGATITVPLDGEMERVNYFCQPEGVLIGEPRQSDGLWTIAYSADPRGDGEIEQIAIRQALTFLGSTATQALDAVGAGDARVLDLQTEVFPGLQRFTFTFDGPETPPIVVGYVNETFPNIPEDKQILRVWASYVTEEDAEYAGPTAVTAQFQPNINQAAIIFDEGRDVMWGVALDKMAGFAIHRGSDPRQIILDVYDPLPGAADRPVLSVGSEGLAVRALQQALVREGYLALLPETAVFNEATRRAVVAFQRDNGIVPNGVVGPETWAALTRSLSGEEGNSPRGVPNSRLQRQSEQPPSITPNSASGANVRSGPGMDYNIIGILPAGQSMEVVGIQPGSDPTTTWLQVCCLEDQVGWVRQDVVRLEGSVSGISGNSPDHPAPGAPENQLAVLPSQRPSHTADGRAILYFTFDDGPSNFTSQVMDSLEQYGGLATFFAIGRSVDANPAIPRDADQRGHSVQNHTYDHPSLDQVDQAQLYNEIDRTQAAIYNATSRLPLCLRPPYGATDDRTFQTAAEFGLEVVLWQIDTQDWMRPGVEAISAHILSNAFPGAIILMHDGGGDRQQSVAALAQALPALQTQGYVFGVLCR